MINEDMKMTRQLTRKAGVDKEIGTLTKVCHWRSPVALFSSWVAIILLVLLGYHVHFALYGLAIVGIGVLQRGLGNLLHDASHSCLHPNRTVNNWLADYLIAIPMGQRFSFYKKNHLLHHKYLGDEELDVDYIKIAPEQRQSIWQICCVNMLNWDTFIGSFLSQLRGGCIGMWGVFVCWWASFLALLSWGLSVQFTIAFVIVWFVSRATIYYLITQFRELADHFGLAPGGIYSFSRNAPKSGVLRFIIHPFNNGYHLTHHLYPNVPWYHLPALDRALMKTSLYGSANHCVNYFSIKSSVVNSLLGSK